MTMIAWLDWGVVWGTLVAVILMVVHGGKGR